MKNTVARFNVSSEAESGNNNFKFQLDSCGGGGLTKNKRGGSYERRLSSIIIAAEV